MRTSHTTISEQVRKLEAALASAGYDGRLECDLHSSTYTYWITHVATGFRQPVGNASEVHEFAKDLLVELRKPVTQAIEVFQEPHLVRL